MIGVCVEGEGSLASSRLLVIGTLFTQFAGGGRLRPAEILADCRQFAMATEIVFGRGCAHDVGGGHHSCNGVRGGRQIGGNDLAATVLGV